MIVVTSRIRVVSGNEDALAEQYRNRLKLAEDEPGCLGVEILRSMDSPEDFVVYSRWRSLDDYQRFRRSSAYRQSHARIADIPGSLRIDAEARVVESFEMLS